jgi:ElaB/YqjD/DUF883 family membrane-anchored ribosome-binding protein
MASSTRAEEMRTMADETEPVDKAVTERGKAVVANAREKAEHLLESAREGTGNLQATVADGLEARAERAARTSPAVARRMDSSAMWLREHDLTNLGDLLRRELRDRPGRVALIALGLGILVGRASRRR